MAAVCNPAWLVNFSIWLCMAKNARKTMLFTSINKSCLAIFIRPFLVIAPIVANFAPRRLSAPLNQALAIAF